MKAIELSLDMGRRIPLYFDVFNPAMPAWNYMFVGGNRNHRSKMISSILLGERLNSFSYKAGYINIFSTNSADPEFLRVMDILGGSSFDITKFSLNIFKYEVKGAAYSEKQFKAILKATQSLREQDPTLESALDLMVRTTVDGHVSSDVLMDQSFASKKFNSVDESLWIKDYATTEPVIQFKERLATVLSGLITTSNTKDTLFYDLLDALNDYYSQNQSEPTFQTFLNFLNEYNLDLYKKLHSLSPDKLDFLHVKNPLVLNEKGNYFYIPNNLPQEGLAYMAVNILHQALSQVWDKRKYLILDGFGEKLDTLSYDLKLECIRTARKTGYSFMASVGEYPKDPTFIKEFQGVFSLNLKSQKEVDLFLTDFPLRHSKRLNGNFTNFLKYDLGVKEYLKNNLTYRSNGLRDLLRDGKSSLVEAQLISNVYEAVKSRFLDLVVTDNKNKVGIWSINRDDLNPTDLIYLENELNAFKCHEGIVILDKEIDEYTLYHEYNFKKVKKKISFITKMALGIALDEMSKQEEDGLFAFSAEKMTNAKILYVDLHNAGLYGLEL